MRDGAGDVVGQVPQRRAVVRGGQGVAAGARPAPACLLVSPLLAVGDRAEVPRGGVGTNGLARRAGLDCRLAGLCSRIAARWRTASPRRSRCLSAQRANTPRARASAHSEAPHEAARPEKPGCSGVSRSPATPPGDRGTVRGDAIPVGPRGGAPVECVDTEAALRAILSSVDGSLAWTVRGCTATHEASAERMSRRCSPAKGWPLFCCSRPHTDRLPESRGGPRSCPARPSSARAGIGREARKVRGLGRSVY
jgi:hypothetical protein